MDEHEKLQLLDDILEEVDWWLSLAETPQEPPLGDLGCGILNTVLKARNGHQK